MILRMFLIISSVVLLQINFAIGQRNISSTLDCGPQDLGFEVIFDTDDLRTFESNSKVFICKQSLPLILRAKDLISGATPPSGNNFSWENIQDHQYGETYEARLQDVDFNNDIATPKVTFQGPNGGKGKKIEIKFVLVNEFLIEELKTNKNSDFTLDENDQPNYPFSLDGLPYKLMIAGDVGERRFIFIKMHQDLLKILNLKLLKMFWISIQEKIFWKLANQVYL